MPPFISVPRMLLCASSVTATRTVRMVNTFTKALVAVAGNSGVEAHQRQPSRHVGRSLTHKIAPPGMRLFSSDHKTPPTAAGDAFSESSFLQSIDLSHPNAADRQKLSKLIQEVVKTKANTGGASLCVLYCMLNPVASNMTC